MRIPAFLLALTLLAPAAALAQKTDDPVVAKVAGDDVRRSEVMDLLEIYGDRLGDLPARERFDVALERTIEMRLMARAARQARLQDKPEVKRQLAQAERDVLQDALIARLVETETSDKALRERYKQLINDGKGFREVKVRHILTYTRGMAELLEKKLENRADFADLARENSVDSRTAPSGGELGWVDKDNASRQFLRAAVAVKVGGFTRNPVETEHGWHLIKVEDERFQKAPPYSEYKAELAKTAVEDSIASLLDQMREDVKVERVDFSSGSTVLREKPPPPRSSRKIDVKREGE